MAVYVSAHGLGHAVRVAAVADALAHLLPLNLTVVAACDRRIWPSSLAACTKQWIPEACDAGVAQSDDVTVDLVATGDRLDRWLDELDSIVRLQTARLDGAFDLVLGDVPSPVFAAAKRAGIPSVAIANFSWDWIYTELGFPAAAEAAAVGYADAGLLVEATPFGTMPAFRERESVGLIARSPSGRRAFVRQLLGLNPRQSLVVLAFQPASAPPLRLPPARAQRVFAAPLGFPDAGSRPDFRTLPDAVTFLDALAAADVVLGKPGYGLVGDVEASGARFLHVPRPGFPENAVLEDYLSQRAGTLALEPRRLAGGAWEDLLEELENADPPPRADTGGAGRAARSIVARFGIDCADGED